MKSLKRSKYGKLEKRNFKWIFLFLLPTLIIFLVFYLGPIIQVFTTSFTKWDGFNAPKFIGLNNFKKLFTSVEFQKSLRNLLLWALLAAIVHVGYGVIVAVILFRKIPGWKFTRAVYMIPNVIAPAAWAIIFKFMFNDDIGVINNGIRIFNHDFHLNWLYTSPAAFWAVTFTWLFYAVVVTLIVLNDFLAIPKELIEAAKIDGATNWQITTRILLPLARNSIGTGVLLSVSSRISMYEQIALTTGGGPGDETMNMPLIVVNSIQDLNHGYANANSLIMFLFGIIAYVIINWIFKMDKSVKE